MVGTSYIKIIMYRYICPGSQSCTLAERNMDNLVTSLENDILGKCHGSSLPPLCTSTNTTKTDGALLRKALLGQTIRYIVSAVVVQEGKVLMMREAKRSCRGTWCLPAGKVKKNESLEEGIIREVREETGLNFQPISIICIDSQETHWFRFTFVGKITGGKLKSLEEEDSESMEAGWFTPSELFSSLALRSLDVRPLIDAGIKWYETRQQNPICRSLPVKKSHKNIIFRLVVVKTQPKDCEKSLFCVVMNEKIGDKSNPHFPYKIVNEFATNVTSTVEKLMRDINSGITYKTHGYLSVEHTGKPSGDADGLCLTLLVEIFIPLEDGILNDNYSWFEVKEQDLLDKIWELIDKGCVELVQC